MFSHFVSHLVPHTSSFADKPIIRISTSQSAYCLTGMKFGELVEITEENGDWSVTPQFLPPITSFVAQFAFFVSFSCRCACVNSVCCWLACSRHTHSVCARRYRGRLNKRGAVYGIFPKNHVHLKPCRRHHDSRWVYINASIHGPLPSFACLLFPRPDL